MRIFSWVQALIIVGVSGLVMLVEAGASCDTIRSREYGVAQGWVDLDGTGLLSLRMKRGDGTEFTTVSNGAMKSYIKGQRLFFCAIPEVGSARCILPGSKD